jgi:hypothetical protein
MTKNNEKVRHNDLSERHIEDIEHKTPRELFERTVGEGHQDDFRTENVQLSSAKGWQLFLLAIPVGLLVLCLALFLWR